MELNFNQTGAFQMSTRTRSPHVGICSNVSIEASHVLVIKETIIPNPFRSGGQYVLKFSNNGILVMCVCVCVRARACACVRLE